MPLTKKSYSFHSKVTRKQPDEEPEEDNAGATCATVRNTSTLRKIKTRGKSFIGRKLNNSEENRENSPEEGLWLRSSVRLRSFRKRKMADRDDANDFYPSERTKLLKMDPNDEIQRRIDDQIKMREGAMRLLSACGNVKQALDASKNLNAINARVLGLMSALQKKRSSLVLKDYNKRNSLEVASMKACPARVAISDIRIPLMWKDDAHYKERSGDPYLLYYMFCFLKMGDQVLDTLLTQIDHKDTDVHFNGPFIFEKVPADFKLDFEIYYTVIINPDRAYTPSSRSSRKGGPLVNIPKYCLAAHAQFDVQNLADGIITTDLVLGGQGAHATAVLGQKEDLPDNQLNLWGQVCLQLSAQPTCMTLTQKEGTLYLQESNGGQPSWGEYDCTLKECSIVCYKRFSNDTETGSSGMVFIKLNRKMRVTESKLPGLGKDFVLILESDGQEKEPVLGFNTYGQCMEWKLALDDSIVNIKAWGVACEKLMQFESRQITLLQSSPQQTLYDQIVLPPLKVADDEAMKEPLADLQDEAMRGDDVSEVAVEGKHQEEKINDSIQEDVEMVTTDFQDTDRKRSVEERDKEIEKENEAGDTEAQADQSDETDRQAEVGVEVTCSSLSEAHAKEESEQTVLAQEREEEKQEVDSIDACETEALTQEKVNRTTDEVSDDIVESERRESAQMEPEEVSRSDSQGDEKCENEEEDTLSDMDANAVLSANVPSDTKTEADTQENEVEKVESGETSQEQPLVGEPQAERPRVDTSQAMSVIAALDEVLDNESDTNEEVGDESVGLNDSSKPDLQLTVSTEDKDPAIEEAEGTNSSVSAVRKSDDEEAAADTQSSKDTSQNPAETTLSTNMDDDELLNEKIGGLEHDEDELLNQKLNVYNGHAEGSNGVTSGGEQAVLKKPFVETEI